MLPNFNSSGSEPLTLESDVYFRNWNQRFKSDLSVRGQEPVCRLPWGQTSCLRHFPELCSGCSQDVAWPED